MILEDQEASADQAGSAGLEATADQEGSAALAVTVDRAASEEEDSRIPEQDPCVEEEVEVAEADHHLEMEVSQSKARQTTREHSTRSCHA